MKSVVEIIDQLRNTSGTNDKIAILHKNKDNETLKDVLYYTYNPYMKYGITEDIYNKTVVCDEHPKGDIFKMFEFLSKVNINDKLKSDVVSYIENNIPNECREVVKCILFKDLKIGIASKGINKAMDDIIPVFDIQLAEAYHKQKEGCLDGKEFAITSKLDGMRMIAIKKGDNVTFYSRQGKEIDGIDYIAEDINKIHPSVVLDGELLLDNVDNLNSDDLYRKTMTIARKKGDKPGLLFHVFDTLEIEEFEQGKSYKCYNKRMDALDNIFKQCEFNHLHQVPILYKGMDQNEIQRQLDIAQSNNEEGVMINLCDAKYECKRSKGILKVKQFHDADMLVLDVHEGTGKNKGKLGAITVQFEHEGQTWSCDCGSGFTDYERVQYWENKDLLPGNIVTIKYFEISSNKQGGYGLRFPTWVGRIRDDKTEISMN